MKQLLTLLSQWFSITWNLVMQCPALPALQVVINILEHFYVREEFKLSSISQDMWNTGTKSRGWLIFCPSSFYVISSHSCFSLPLLQAIAEFDLGTINYEVKSPKCHELSLLAPPHERISFNFRCEQEAQEWATVVLSSLREAHRGQLYFLPNLLHNHHSRNVG